MEVTMNLKETVNTKLNEMGVTPTTVLNKTMEGSLKPLQFMGLYNLRDICTFYTTHANEIVPLCREDPELLSSKSLPAGIQLAIEITMIQLEVE